MDQQAFLKADKRFQTAWQSLGCGLTMLALSGLLIWGLSTTWASDGADEKPAPRRAVKESPGVEAIPGAMKFLFLGCGALILLRSGILIIKDSLPRKPQRPD